MTSPSGQLSLLATGHRALEPSVYFPSNMFRGIEFFVDQKIDYEGIVRQFVDSGYQSVERVCQEGDFARRGSVLDVFPANFDSPIRIDTDDDAIRSIASFNIETGKNIWFHQIVIILPVQASSNRTPFTADVPLNHFVDIQKGDFVVHNQHGIGKFLGIKELETSTPEKEHLIIEYAQGDKLFVPKHDIHLVQKYVSFNKTPPRIYKLGTKEWQRVCRQIEKKLATTAAELLHIQAARAGLKGFASAPDNEWQKEFEATFPYEETPDQIKSTTEVKKDMESQQPMDRLICGDVGYGKTEVAMRAIFKTVMNNKQVALLVPTTILAEQHYYNFSLRMKKFPVKIAMLNRFRTKAEQAKIVKDLAEGKIDIVIGTHRLLSKDVAFKDLGLIVVDEEQRFGVKAKERLKHLRLLADVLTLTATPIPRTLYMALSGARDMSVISTPPKNRIPVETQIVEFDEALIKKAIDSELARRGQVFFLHNRVQDIEKIAGIIRRLVKGARVAIGHGQMPGKVLEDIMLEFLEGEIDVLVCTTIIESGIDIPNANTLIVNRADRFGLADLHQLRGRVGRQKVKAFAYFIVPKHSRMTMIAQERLKALLKYSDLGSGFQIAFEDLQLRGGGNILGQEQSGFIASVGFDLYCRLLKESIEHLKRSRRF